MQDETIAKDALLQSNPVWPFFDSLTKVPRPSKHEELVVQYLVDFATQRGIEFKKDSVGNILMSLPATPGCEALEPVILQAHVDMVCEKNSDVEHDFLKDPIPYYVSNDGWVRTHGTTLGADDGIGVACALAVADGGLNGKVSHGPLHLLFTIDEETGLTGAYNVGVDFLPAKTLINLDSEDMGQIFIGCAGGCTTTASLPLVREQAPQGMLGINLSVGGLLGGHSGGDIHLGRANANQIMARLVQRVASVCGFRVARFNGGNLHNAIAREAVCVGAVPFAQKENIRVELNVFLSEIQEEFAGVEPSVCMDLESDSVPESLLSLESQNRLVNLLLALPHGVIAMSHTIENLVQTSTNLASVKMSDDGDKALFVTSQRSSVESGKEYAQAMVAAAFRLAGAEVQTSEGYPSWTPNIQSAILKKACDAHRKLFNQDALVLAIHAGLECGLFLDKKKDMDMISVGPTLRAVHSPDEAVDIKSVDEFWRFLLEILNH